MKGAAGLRDWLAMRGIPYGLLTFPLKHAFALLEGGQLETYRWQAILNFGGIQNKWLDAIRSAERLDGIMGLKDMIVSYIPGRDEYTSVFKIG